MERSSSQRDLRNERLSRTPYSRPEPSRLRKSTSMTPLATLKSIVSFVSSPFTRSSVLPQHTDDLDLDVSVDAAYERSESGSEDEWNGEPPTLMEGQDVFSLAAAAGRQGREFNQRAATWRARGEQPGGRREQARLGLEAQPTLTDLEPPTPTAPGHFNLLKSSPSMPVLSSTTQSSTLQIPGAREAEPSNRRARSPLASDQNTTLPARSPLPSFVSSTTSVAPVSPATPGLSSSASSVALTAFLEAKKGQQMTTEDFRVIETLTENMKAESHVGSPPRSERSGWAAGSYPSNLRSSHSFANLSTPAKQTNGHVSSPGTAFSLGSTSAVQPSPYKQRYLGPGMSPRRMFPQPKKSSLKPLFNFGAAADEVSKGKKRRTADDQIEVMDVDESTSTVSTSSAPPAKTLSSSASMPSLSSSANPSPLNKSTSKLPTAHHTPARPSPLGQNFGSPGSVGPTLGDDAKAKRKADAEATGRKRAAEIIMDIIDEEIGPVVPTRKAEPVVFNPYDRTSLNPSASSAPAVPATTPSTAFAGSTPRKPGLRSQGSPAKRTPTRGAAAKLEAHREAMKGSKPLTTIERIKGVRPWEKDGSPAKSKGRVETPTPDEDDLIEIDELFDESAAASSRAPSPGPAREPSPPSGPTFTAASAKIPAVETFKPFAPPAVTFSPQPLPKPSPAPSIGSFDSPTRDSIIAASKAEEKIDRPTFTFTPAPPAEQEKIEPLRNLSTVSTSKLDLTSVYLSAKDSALKIAKPALPFFTFTLPARPHEPAKSKAQAEAVKAEASKRTPPSFTFTLTATTSPAVTAPAPAASAAQWTCGLCGLKNPASATEECTICEAPKPAAAPAKPASSGFAMPASTGSGGGEWTCGLCGLKNPAGATAQCTVCEEPRPKPTSTFTSTTPASSTFNFGFGAATSSTQSSAAPASGSGGDWICSLCSLKNPASATVQCQVCEQPKPKL